MWRLFLLIYFQCHYYFNYLVDDVRIFSLNLHHNAASFQTILNYWNNKIKMRIFFFNNSGPYHIIIKIRNFSFYSIVLMWETNKNCHTNLMKFEKIAIKKGVIPIYSNFSSTTLSMLYWAYETCWFIH